MSCVLISICVCITRMKMNTAQHISDLSSDTQAVHLRPPAVPKTPFEGEECPCREAHLLGEQQGCDLARWLKQ